MTSTQVPDGSAESSHSPYGRSLSISETLEQNNSGLIKAPGFLRWIEYPFHIPNPKNGQKLPEAAGWAMDSAGRGPLNLIGSFVGGAVLRMAIVEAGGPNNTVRGLLKPSSLLTAASAVTGVIAAILMPIVGALVDHTSHRRALGAVSGLLAVGLVGVQISVSEERNNWFFILIIDMLQSFFMLVHVTAIFAYLPDLTLDEEVMSHYTGRIFVRQYAGSFGIMTLLIITNHARDIDNAMASTVQTARDGCTLAFTWGVILIGYAWIFLFRDRPALSKVPEGSNLLNTGFVQVFRTTRKIWTKYNALKWFMLSLLFSPETGAGVVLSIAVTYVTVAIKFTGDELSISVLTLLVGTVIGSYCAKYLCRWLNPLNAYRSGMTVFGLSLGLSTFILVDETDKELVYLMAAVWGFCMGWAYPSQRVLFCTLTPKGQETEIMGLFTFTGQILGWVPPAIVTVMNEKGIDIKWSLYVILGFCVFAVAVTLPMGSYRDACELVAKDSQEKFAAVKASLPSEAIKEVPDETAPFERSSVETSPPDSHEASETVA